LKVNLLLKDNMNPEVYMIHWI